jgi:hypothetical protein
MRDGAYLDGSVPLFGQQKGVVAGGAACSYPALAIASAAAAATQHSVMDLLLHPHVAVWVAQGQASAAT